MLDQLLANGVAAGGAYTLTALGINVIYATTKVMPFSQGGIYTLSAYMTYFCWSHLHLSFFISAALGVLVSAVAGSIVEVITFQQFRRYRALSLQGLLASLGILIVVQNTVALIAGNEPLSLRDGRIQEGIQIARVLVTPWQLYMLALSTMLLLVTWWSLMRTKWGAMTRAVANDFSLSVAIGIPVHGVALFSAALGSFLTAVSGIAVSYETGLTPLMGFHALLMGITSVIVGGVGSILGCLVGGMFVGLIQNLSAYLLPTEWRDIVVFPVLIAFLVLRRRNPRDLDT